jgi:nitroreductase
MGQPSGMGIHRGKGPRINTESHRHLLGYQSREKMLGSAIVILVACSKTGESATRIVQRTKFADWYMFDLGLAVENICLRAHDMGLGTVIVGSMDHDACRSLLSLPEGFEVVAAIPVGRPALPPKEGPSRREIKSCAHLNSFGAPFSAKHR